MKTLLHYYMISLVVLLFSCKDNLQEKDALSINQQGIVLMNDGKYQEALQAFLKAANSPRISKSDKGVIYRNISLAYNELKIADSAAHFSALAAKCYRKNSYDYLLNMAEFELFSGKTAAALQRLLRAVQLDPEDMAVNNSLGLIYLGDYGESFTDLDKALEYNTKAFEISGSRITEDILGRTLYETGDYKKAEAHYAHLLQDYPDIATYLINMGMIKYKLDKKIEGEPYFEKALVQDSSYRETISVFKENNQ